MREGWKNKNIEEISKILNGGTPKTKIKEYWDGDIAWITPADLGKNKSIYVSNTSRKITKLGLEKSSAKLFPSNSIVLSTRAPIGHLAINTIEMSTNQGCRGIVPTKECDTKYLFYFLYSNVELLNNLGTGTTFKELSTKALATLSIPIPPLPEQKQIVAILDKAFAAIDQAKANIEKNIENVKELFQSKLNEILARKVRVGMRRSWGRYVNMTNQNTME
jgi:type I restriction enzyme S subunit